MSDKIIHSFQQRRQLTQAIDELAETTSEASLLAHVREIARTFPSDLLVNTLIKYLETPSGQLRGGLGHLASLLPPEEIGPALRSAAANRSNSTQARVTAALILERFMGESLSPAALNDLNQTNEVAYQSLREAVDESRTNRHILLEYVTQMRQTDEAIAFMVMELMERLEPAERIDLYRLLALDDRPNVAKTATQALEVLALQHELPAALKALQALRMMLPPDRAEPLARTLRKLQFAGKRYPMPDATGWHALMSPADIGGTFTVWFAYHPQPHVADPNQSDHAVENANIQNVANVEEAEDAAAKPASDAVSEQGALLGAVVNLGQGILQAFGSEQMPPQELPPPKELGVLVPVRTDSGDPATLLEIPFDVGRYLLAQGHSAHWQAQSPQELPGEYRLYTDRLWAFGEPEAPPEVTDYLAGDSTEKPQDGAHGKQHEDPDAGDTLQGEFAPARLHEYAVELLSHSAMQGWTLQNRLFLQGIGRAGNALAQLTVEEIVAIILRELTQHPDHQQFIHAIDMGLRAQAVWLHYFGNPANAAKAHTLAQAATSLPLDQNPFVALLVEDGVRRARTHQGQDEEPSA